MVVSHLTSLVVREISKLPRKTQITGPVGYFRINDPKRNTVCFQRYSLSHIHIGISCHTRNC